MINFLCLLCSLCIQFASAGITPYNMLPNNQSGVGDAQIDIVFDRIRNNYQGYWGDSYRWVLDVPRESIIVIKGFTLWGAYNNEYTVLVPKEYNDSNVSSVLQCNSYTVGQDDVVNSVSLNFNQYIQFCTTYTYVNDPYVAGFQSFQFDSSTNWELVYCEVPIYCNGDLVVNVTDDVTVPEFPSLPGIGSLGAGGHSSGGSPLESLQGFSWTAHSSTYTQSGHNSHVNPSHATPDFTNATQNLLGQIVDNTNSIIENTNSLGGTLETINGNIINGAGAIFNAISQLNSNFVSSVIIDKEELNDQWLASNTYLAFASMQNSFNLLQSTADDLIDRYSATEDVDELIIPIDLTVWQIESSNYGDFKPFDQVYYMRFGFLDETKALWQPLFIALLYFCLFYGIVLDLPNIIRGVKS